jgi:hypothetical protein
MSTQTNIHAAPAANSATEWRGSNPMANVDHAYRWSTRQAARQFLQRNKAKLPGEGWKQIDLTRLGAPEVSL